MKTPISESPHPVDLSGTHKIYRFENDFGASVVKFKYSYGGDQGLFELAVIEFKNDDDSSWQFCYTTPITNDVIGYLTSQEVEKYLDEIELLPGIKPNTSKPLICHKHG